MTQLNRTEVDSTDSTIDNETELRFSVDLSPLGSLNIITRGQSMNQL